MSPLKCMIIVTAGIVSEKPTNTRQWNITEADLNNPPTYIDKTGAAMNYAMSLQNPDKVNWVKFQWVWM